MIDLYHDDSGVFQGYLRDKIEKGGELKYDDIKTIGSKISPAVEFIKPIESIEIKFLEPDLAGDKAVSAEFFTQKSKSTENPNPKPDGMDFQSMMMVGDKTGLLSKDKYERFLFFYVN
jgi:hypothetical protein